MRKQEDLLRRKEVLPLLKQLYQVIDTYKQIHEVDAYDYEALYDKGVHDDDVSISDLHWYKYNYDISTKCIQDSEQMCEYIERLYHYLKENGEFINTAIHKWDRK